MGTRRASGTAVAAVVGATLLMTLLVGWAASVGPSRVLAGDGPDIARVVPTETASVESSGEAALDDAARTRERSDGSDLFRAVALVAEVLVALAAAYLLLRAVGRARETWQARRRRDPTAGDVEFDVLESPALLTGVLAAEAAGQRDLLLTGGSARNAVVAAWSRFETAAARVGARRRPWETSSEFTLRVLEAVDADWAAVGRLAGLYREARFSEHELTEDHRAAALEALDRIHASIGVPSGGFAGGAR